MNKELSLLKMVKLNLGSGPVPIHGMLNVDNEPFFKPDQIVDLSVFPWPWESDTVDAVLASHVIEHIPEWQKFFSECVRILKPGGTLRIVVPHFNDIESMTEDGHLHVFSLMTFKHLAHGIRNTWREGREHLYPPDDKLPIRLIGYDQVTHQRLMRFCPRWLMLFLLRHTLGFGIEQHFIFIKIG